MIRSCDATKWNNAHLSLSHYHYFLDGLLLTVFSSLFVHLRSVIHMSSAVLRLCVSAAHWCVTCLQLVTYILPELFHKPWQSVFKVSFTHKCRWRRNCLLSQSNLFMMCLSSGRSCVLQPCFTKNTPTLSHYGNYVTDDARNFGWQTFKGCATFLEQCLLRSKWSRLVYLITSCSHTQIHLSLTAPPFSPTITLSSEMWWIYRSRYQSRNHWNQHQD